MVDLHRWELIIMSRRKIKIREKKKKVKNNLMKSMNEMIELRDKIKGLINLTDKAREELDKLEVVDE